MSESLAAAYAIGRRARRATPVLGDDSISATLSDTQASTITHPTHSGPRRRESNGWSRGNLQYNYFSTGYCPGDVRHVPVMREDDWLYSVSDCRQCRKTVCGTVFIETCKQIVPDERSGFSTAGVFLKIGKAQGEIELVARSGAHSRYLHRFTCRSASDKPRHVMLVEFLADAREAIPGKHGK